VSARVRKIEQVWRELAQNENDAGLPETRAPDAGFAAVLHDWVEGDDLATVLARDDEITGGDFVRQVKQSIDLLHQLSEIAPDPATRAAARAAGDRCRRGVVAASSVVAA
jgi:ATP-dependent RNA helicase HelY